MEKSITQIYQVLQKLIGFHRQLLDIVRSEREAITNADLKAIQDATYAKTALVEAIRQAEQQRQEFVAELSIQWKRPASDLTLPNIIIAVQGTDLPAADQLRSAYQALLLLIQRVTEQNSYNKTLVERSLENIHTMKKNVLGEAAPRSDTYTQNGQRQNGGNAGSRLLSREV